MESRLDKRSRCLLALAGLLSVLLIAVVVNYLVHGGADELNPVAEAAQRTAAMPGARLKMEVTYTVLGASKPIVANGAGAFDARSGRSRIHLTVAVPGRGPTTLTSVGDQRVAFIHSALFAAELPPGKEWLGMEPLLGHSPQDALGSGPGAGSTIEMLKAAGGDVEELDHQQVRGHRTTRYKSSIDFSDVAEALAEHGEGELAREYEEFAEKAPDPIPVEVWVDERGLARLVRMVQEVPLSSGGPALTMDMRMEFFDFGIQPKIALPPKGRVLDTTPVIRAELGLAKGTSLGPLDPPAGAKPLSQAEFQRRATAICRRANDEGERLLPRERQVVGQFERLDRSAIESGAAKPLLLATGRWFEDGVFRIGVRALHELRLLAPPPAQADDYRRYLQLTAQHGEWILATARAYQLGAYKVPGAEDHEAEERRRKKEQASLTASLGIPACAQDAGAGAGETA
jgi:hypothetical protein